MDGIGGRCVAEHLYEDGVCAGGHIRERECPASTRAHGTIELEQEYGRADDWNARALHGADHRLCPGRGCSKERGAEYKNGSAEDGSQAVHDAPWVLALMRTNSATASPGVSTHYRLFPPAPTAGTLRSCSSLLNAARSSLSIALRVASSLSSLPDSSANTSSSWDVGAASALCTIALSVNSWL